MIDRSLFEDPFDKMMTIITGDHWKHVRNLCTPTFTSGKLKRVSNMFVTSSRFLTGRPSDTWEG